MVTGMCITDKELIDKQHFRRKKKPYHKKIEYFRLYLVILFWLCTLRYFICVQVNNKLDNAHMVIPVPKCIVKYTHIHNIDFYFHKRILI